jgi:polar amino acid transport system permease protein
MTEDLFKVWQHRDLLYRGLANTVILSAFASVCALVLGAALAAGLLHRRRIVSGASRAFVDAFRCTPFLLFAYILYFGLPSAGIRLDNWSSGLVALAIYHTAYMGELLASSWRALPREPIEAGQAFGFTGLRLFRRIVLPPLVLNAAPVLGNQTIQVIKDSAFLTVIALPELTHAASAIQSNYYVPFAAFIVAMLIYWALCLVIEACVAVTGRMAEARR